MGCCNERRLACTERKVSALVPLLSSDALVFADVDGCPSTSPLELGLLEVNDELELLLRLVELTWVLWGGPWLDELTESE